MKPFETTIATLTKSRNEAATPTLLAALATSEGQVFTGVVGALVQRRSKAGHASVVALWHSLGPAERAHFNGNRGRMATALREAVLSADAQLFANGCEIARAVDEFDLLPTLVTLAEQNNSDRAKPALALALELVARLEKMSHDSIDARDQQNTDVIRQAVLECLQRSVERFRAHRRNELIEAFVSLSGPENPALLAILNAPHHPCFATVVDILSRSASPAVLGLLTTLLVAPDGPQVIRNVVGKRTDEPFTAALLAARYDWANAALGKTLHRIKAFACLDVPQFAARISTPAEQLTALKIVAASGVSDEQKLDFIEHILSYGAVDSRLAATNALQPIAGQRSNDLTLKALDDEEPEIQIAAARQVRSRHIPGTMAKLVELAGSKSAAVQQAAREALPEFTLEGFLLQFDTLDETQRQTSAALTARLDPGAVERLREELDSPVGRRRLRALEAIKLMRLAPQVADALVERLSDEDHMVRAAAAEALEGCRGGDVRQALLEALGDRSAAVQNAARVSLEAIAAGGVR